jgi:acyl-CoA synthetase (AMP-forming)/AMP-acid ligase II
MVTIPKFEPALYLKLLKEHNVTIAHVAPPLINFLAKHPAVDSVLPLPALRELFSGAAPLGDDLANAAKQRLKVDIIRQGYGMTEMSPASHIGPRSNPKGGSIGCLVPAMEMKLINPVDGTAVTGPGKEGEIWLRGPNIMKGYYKNEEETRNAIDSDGFLHTGDVAIIDAEKQVWIVDRIKELIKVKGFQVAPAELEATLAKCDKIADAAVIGVAAGHKYGGQEGDGQIPKAFVVKKDQSLTEEEVKAFIKSELRTLYKQLGAVEFIDAVPKSASGKILRKNLRKKEEDAGVKTFA